MYEVNIPTPRWAEPLLAPARYKGAHGGRSSGKSHEFAEMMVEECIADAYLPCVCLREIQKSLRFSAKRLIEAKIRELKAQSYFTVLDNEIRRNRGDGIIIFQGMQDHTAETIKSLEGFMRAWIEEGEKFSEKSLRLLRATIRAPGSQIWASWNPFLPTDAVDEFFRGEFADQVKDMVCVETNYYDNPWIPQESLDDAELDKQRDFELYLHTWEGAYNFRSDSQVFADKWEVLDFNIDDMIDTVKGPKHSPDGPYYGLDFGFALNPTAGVRCWIWNDCLYVDYTQSKLKLDITDTNELMCEIPGAERHPISADCSRPETISHMRKAWKDEAGRKRPGLNVRGCDKWSGSIKDGITYLRSFKKIYIHPRCKGLIAEAMAYSYKIDKSSGRILPDVVDLNNDHWDALRYALDKHIHAFKGSKLDKWI